MQGLSMLTCLWKFLVSLNYRWNHFTIKWKTIEIVYLVNLLRFHFQIFEVRQLKYLLILMISPARWFLIPDAKKENKTWSRVYMFFLKSLPLVYSNIPLYSHSFQVSRHYAYSFSLRSGHSLPIMLQLNAINIIIINTLRVMKMYIFTTRLVSIFKVFKETVKCNQI